MGLPMVMTSVANEGILAQHGRHVFIADASDQFAKHVVDLLHDRQLQHELGRRARDFVVQNWSWEKHFTDLEEMFVTLADERKRADEISSQPLTSSFNRDPEVAAEKLANAARSSAFMRFRDPKSHRKTA